MGNETKQDPKMNDENSPPSPFPSPLDNLDLSKVTAESIKRELEAAITQIIILAGGYKFESRPQESRDMENRALGLMAFGVNAGLISKRQFNEFQKMRQNVML